VIRSLPVPPRLASGARPPAAVAVLVVAAGLGALPGCGREPPRFIPPGADSAASALQDSLAARVDQVRGQWEGQGSAAAAASTAALLTDDLRRHPDRAVAERGRAFLDSCGFSAEIAGVGDMAAVNFFARSDPAGGAWPYIVWREGEVVRSQALEGSGMRLLDFTSRGDPAEGAGDAADPPQVAAIFARTSTRGQQPVVIVWRRPPGGSWSLVQTLGPDSLGGVGSAEFFQGADGAPGLEARTYRSTPGFDECATCPHIYRTLRFEWRRGGFGRVSEEVAISPYHSFVQLVAALSVNDREQALRYLADPSLLETLQSMDWSRARGVWRMAPGADESAEEMTFFRGTREAYKVRFASHGGQWVITDLQPTQRTVE
jgi:hypothetical protein